VQTADLIFSALLLCVCVAFIGLTLRSQILLTLNEPMAIARGVSVTTQRTTFIVLLSLVVGISIKAIGVLLISAFVVIPACAARLLSPDNKGDGSHCPPRHSRRKDDERAAHQQNGGAVGIDA